MSNRKRPRNHKRPWHVAAEQARVMRDIEPKPRKAPKGWDIAETSTDQQTEES